MPKVRDQNNCPARCMIDCRANLKGGECKAPWIEAVNKHQPNTILQFDKEVYEDLQRRSQTEVFAFEKDYFDGAHALFVILRNRGLLKTPHQ